MKFKNLSAMFLAAVFGGLVALYAYARIIESGDNHPDAAYNKPAHFASLDPQNIVDVSYPDLTYAAEKAVNCVVHVKIKSTQTRFSGSGNPLYDFLYGYRRERVPVEAFVGSGVIISSDGYIITNNHVISRAEEVEVSLNDQRVLPARLIGTDPNTDLALLKVDETDLPFLTFGDSEALRVGEWVLAVGNPYNLTSTVTAGIVSAKARQLGVIEPQTQMGIESFIQTDAAVNPGNSGGALVNTRGELMGINTLIYSRTGDFSGTAFAIPVTIVQKVLADLKEFGQVQRAYLGISFSRDENNSSNSEKNELSIKNVLENGGAAAAGIKIGDIVVAINDVTVNTFAELQEQISKFRPNDQVKVSVIRDKKTQHFTVTLRNIEGTTQILRGENQINILGATFVALTSKEKQDLGLKSGVKISDVGQGKLSSLGIRNGFIITSINDKPVNSATDIQSIVNTVEEKGRILINGVNSKGEVSYYVFAKE